MERCDRRGCKGEATARIPLPVGLSNRYIMVCAAHEAIARTACFYVLRINQTDDAGDTDFKARVLAKHLKLRGTEELLHLPRHRWVKGDRWAR